ncbi:hypothetical protein [Salmonirosea aquatica]|uniref:Uncharacterized protein n=1 Tax=Salmonirosea aquatica TaxID=2654236 RepID=A0A7C9BV63_9BACT|nr:hypothetical protein [Cytophagaceae bacterium SJW1-29]
MYTIESDIGKVALRFAVHLQGVEDTLADDLVEAAGDGMAAVTHRIQHRGLNTDGQPMLSQSARRTGAYSRIWGAYRRKRGRQADRVDFTMEGDLMRNYQIIYKTSREVTVGFLDGGMADIAAYLEAYFGAAFYLSTEEQAIVLKTLSSRIYQKLDV